MEYCGQCSDVCNSRGVVEDLGDWLLASTSVPDCRGLEKVA